MQDFIDKLSNISNMFKGCVPHISQPYNTMGNTSFSNNLHWMSIGNTIFFLLPVNKIVLNFVIIVHGNTKI